MQVIGIFLELYVWQKLSVNKSSIKMKIKRCSFLSEQTFARFPLTTSYVVHHVTAWPWPLTFDLWSFNVKTASADTRVTANCFTASRSTVRKHEPTWDRQTDRSVRQRDGSQCCRSTIAVFICTVYVCEHVPLTTRFRLCDSILHKSVCFPRTSRMLQRSTLTLLF